MNQKCVDPCPGSCGINTQCTVINHTPSCTCDAGYTGDPFQGCVKIVIQGKYPFFIYLRNIAEMPFIKTMETLLTWEVSTQQNNTQNAILIKALLLVFK